MTRESPFDDHDRSNEESACHLVLKRGHKGRFRFALMADQARMTGEVVVERGLDRDTERARAINLIARLSQQLSGALVGLENGRASLRATVGTDATADEHGRGGESGNRGPHGEV